MKEKFEERTLTGPMNVACKYDDGTIRYWNHLKEVVISHIKDIVSTYAKDRYILTLRQLHYQLVTKNWTVNHDTAYKKLSSILDDCRYSGEVDWKGFEDRGRVPSIPYMVDDIADAFQDTINTYRIDRQKGQPNHVELWTEKDALSGILSRSTRKYGIYLVVNKGYTSSSAIYGAYERIVERILNGQSVTILYFGDHDPSGLDMIRDIRERLTFFLSHGNQLMKAPNFAAKVEDWWDEHEYTWYDLNHHEYLSDKQMDDLSRGSDEIGYVRFDKAATAFDAGKLAWYISEQNLFSVKAIGLTMEQIKKYNLPPNPTKMTDSRADGYVRLYGKTCWEVDALDPKTLTEIVETNIQETIDMDLYRETLAKEETDKNKIREIIEGLDTEDDE